MSLSMIGPTTLHSALTEFARQNNFRGKGPLSVALFVTETASRGLPLDPERLVTVGARGGGQVAGLGKDPIQRILARHGIVQMLAAEGGRTSRGSLQNMRAYVAFLNSWFAEVGTVDFTEVERFWIAQVQLFFAGHPLKLRQQQGKSVHALLRDLISQAVERERQTSGNRYAGPVLQHLIGAKLDVRLGSGHVQHHGASTSDASTGRVGDFVLGSVAIHVTTHPALHVIGRCQENIAAGIRPILITLFDQVERARVLADERGILDALEIFAAEDFLASNLHELGAFEDSKRRDATEALIARYNEIVEEKETDPSLRIELD